MKFCVKNGIECSEAFKILKKALGDDAMSQPRVYGWHKRFREGREDFEDNARPGRPSTSITDENVKKIKAIIYEKFVLRPSDIEIIVEIIQTGTIRQSVYSY